MHNHEIIIRAASRADLVAINQLIEKAVMTWQLPERVKRLALPSYRYDELDLQHFSMVVATDDDNIVGIAAWETEYCLGPDDKKGLLLHGLYVNPEQQRRGIGGQLLKAVEASARSQHADGLLVKVQKDAEDFFSTQGLYRLAVQDPNRDYENRYWKAL